MKLDSCNVNHLFFFFSSRRRHTRLQGDWSSDVCSSDLQERLSVRLLDTAAELPAHQRMHLGVLVDRPIDRYEQPRALEGLQVLVKVGIGALRRGARIAALRFGRRADFGFLRHGRALSVQEVYQRDDDGNIATPRRFANAWSSS